MAPIDLIVGEEYSVSKLRLSGYEVCADKFVDGMPIIVRGRNNQYNGRVMLSKGMHKRAAVVHVLGLDAKSK